ncbi:AAA family ATPase [Geomonas subterranea]|uniref:AAA family ATPase n=1 Tax=Geomonas subterranea TaxID=2847989 RepID=UPI001CD76CA4|nr:AAA family ATPase [Geomonas fuzhouensis]
MNARFIKAQKQQTKGRIILAGTAGAGRIRGAIALAAGMTAAKIAVLDTEGMANLHSDVSEFDVLEMSAPFTTDKFVAVVEAAEKEGYGALIIDSLSQAWAGEGGILEQVGKLTASKGNKNGVWDTVQPQHDEMMNRIRKANLHVLVILQCKTEYLVADTPGALAPKKIGLAPVQRDGIDYGFHAVFYVDEPSQVATCSADHTGLFGGTFAEILTKTHGEQLRTWLESGVAAPAVATPEVKDVKETKAAPPSGNATALFINAAQVTTLKTLLTETNTDTLRFLSHFKVEKLENFPAARLDEAKVMLESKKAKASEAPAPSEGTHNDNSGNLTEMLKARNIPFTEGAEGIAAKPKFTDNAAKAFLKEQGFSWDAKGKAWVFKQAA